VVFWPLAVAQYWDQELFAQRSMVYVMRTSRIADPSLQDEVRRVIWSVNPNLPLALYARSTRSPAGRWRERRSLW